MLEGSTEEGSSGISMMFEVDVAVEEGTEDLLVDVDLGKEGFGCCCWGDLFGGINGVDFCCCCCWAEIGEETEVCIDLKGVEEGFKILLLAVDVEGGEI